MSVQEGNSKKGDELTRLTYDENCDVVPCDHPTSGISCPPLAVPLEGDYQLILWRVTLVSGEKKVFSSIIPPITKRIPIRAWKKLADPEIQRQIKFYRDFLLSDEPDPEDMYIAFHDPTDQYGTLVREVVEIRPEVQEAYREEVVLEKNMHKQVYLRVFPPIMTDEQLLAVMSQKKMAEIDQALFTLVNRD